MPNWCANELTIKGKSMQACLSAIAGKEGPIDFDKIVPMPPILSEVESGSKTDMGLVILGQNPKRAEEMLSYPWVRDAGITTVTELIPFLQERYPEAEEMGRKAMQAIAETGYQDWYEWSVDNWGTKWNAGSGTLKEGTSSAKIDFDTAWSPPKPVMLALSSMFPDLTIKLKYWECGMGFKGELVCKNGAVEKDESGNYRGHKGG